MNNLVSLASENRVRAMLCGSLPLLLAACGASDSGSSQAPVQAPQFAASSFTSTQRSPRHTRPRPHAVAQAFGVELIEHPEIMAMMEARFGDQLNAARRRMARVPVGGDLVKNPVQGPPGFTIGNVFTLAGVPQIMRGMLEDVGPRMRGGRPTISRTVRVEGSGEGVIAAPLEAVAKAHPEMSLGSYPFFEAGNYGSNLVLRSRDMVELEQTVAELIAALKSAGVENVQSVEAPPGV